MFWTVVYMLLGFAFTFVIETVTLSIKYSHEKPQGLTQKEEESKGAMWTLPIFSLLCALAFIGPKCCLITFALLISQYNSMKADVLPVLVILITLVCFAASSYEAEWVSQRLRSGDSDASWPTVGLILGPINFAVAIMIVVR